MKKTLRMRFVALFAALSFAVALLCACGAPAPTGMYAPSDAEEYKTGVEDIVFSVPSDYTVTMSSNMLAAKNGGSSFSIQCRHSDYVYNDLKKNYEELKAQLTALYGAYEETLKEDAKVAGREALEARYDLTVAGRECSYIQYLFYGEDTKFYLFTYCTDKGQTDEGLLSSVLETVSFDKENYQAPAGRRVVENAQGDLLHTDRYELYCPDEWVFDLSLGMVCMRVPAATILSNISFAEIEEGGDPAAFVSDYAASVSSLDVSDLTPLEGYILSSVDQMYGSLTDFKLSTISEEDAAPAREELKAKKDCFLQTYTNESGVLFTFIDFKASLPDHTSHGSGGLFVESGEESETAAIENKPYHIRQYFTEKDGYIYLFTYTASEEYFDAQYEDAYKVIKNFAYVYPER